MKIMWQGKRVDIKELNAGELMAAYDYYHGETFNCADGSLFEALDALYNEIIRRMEK